MKKSLISLLATLLVMFALPTLSASAAPANSHLQKRYCTEELLPLVKGQLSSRVVKTGCFATLSQSIAFGTNGAIRLSATATQKDLTSTLVKSTGFHPFDVLPIAYLYSDTRLEGSQLTITGANACTGYADYGLSPMPSGWNKVVSSLLGGVSPDNCYYTTLYSSAGYAQNATTAPSECFKNEADTLGTTMNNQTQSVIWGKLDPSASGNSPYQPTMNTTVGSCVGGP